MIYLTRPAMTPICNRAALPSMAAAPAASFSTDLANHVGATNENLWQSGGGLILGRNGYGVVCATSALAYHRVGVPNLVRL